jgi:hypothetical protein
MILESVQVAYVASFMFVFAVVFGVLNYAKILGFSKQVNAVVAIVIGAFSVVYEPFVLGMEQYIPYAAALFVVIFFILVIKKAFAGGKDEKFDALPIIVSLVIMLVLLGIFWEQLSYFVPANVDPMNVLWAIGIIVRVGIFWAVYRQPAEKK